MAVGARDGTVSLFEIVPGDEAEGQSDNLSDTILAQVRSLIENNEPERACAMLKSALAANAADRTLYDEYIRVKDAWHASASASGKQAMQSGDARTAIRTYAAMLEEDPLCTDAAILLREARSVRAAQLVEEAHAHESAADFVGAEFSLREAAAVAPLNLGEPRCALAEFLDRRAIAADAQAERLVRDGDKQGALNTLMSIQSTCPGAERASRIRGLKTDVEFDAGMKAYNAKQYVQAVFQFKKVLRLDKNHSEAQRHLEFARRFSQESSTDSLQDRFSRLE